jgi:hypothetical protein
MKKIAINSFHPNVLMFSGGCTRAGSLSMILNLDIHICQTLLKNKGFKFLIKLRIHKGEEALEKAIDQLLDGWWKK